MGGTGLEASESFEPLGYTAAAAAAAALLEKRSSPCSEDVMINTRGESWCFEPRQPLGITPGLSTLEEEDSMINK